MHYRLFISEKARQQLRALEKSIRRNIGYRMEFLRDDLKGDVKKLEAKGNSYRLRIGSIASSLRWKVTRSPSMLSETERKRMSDTVTADHPEPLTLEKVYRELQVLRERVEDLEDLRDLGEAIAENAGKPLIPWEEAKKDLDLD